MDEVDHLPVLLHEVVELLAPAATATERTGGAVIVDCTVGLGGHAEALLEACGSACRLIGIDLDETNLLKTKERLRRFGQRVRLFEANFAELRAVMDEVETASADVILADLGISSGTQMDDPARGFSFQADGPLDMRLARHGGRTAADLVNGLDEGDLADLIFRYGEERYSRRIARAIVWARKESRIESTGRLAEIIVQAVPPRRPGRHAIHPATRSFLALRIGTNEELANLEGLLAAIPKVLAPGGRAGIISFHSLEDRLVKRAFAETVQAGVARRLTPKPRVAGPTEIEMNPRSRSAKLRVVERI